MNFLRNFSAKRISQAEADLLTAFKSTLVPYVESQFFNATISYQHKGLLLTIITPRVKAQFIINHTQDGSSMHDLPTQQVNHSTAQYIASLLQPKSIINIPPVCKAYLRPLPPTPASYKVIARTLLSEALTSILKFSNSFHSFQVSVVENKPELLITSASAPILINEMFKDLSIPISFKQVTTHSHWPDLAVFSSLKDQVTDQQNKRISQSQREAARLLAYLDSHGIPAIQEDYGVVCSPFLFLTLDWIKPNPLKSFCGRSAELLSYDESLKLFQLIKDYPMYQLPMQQETPLQLPLSTALELE